MSVLGLPVGSIGSLVATHLAQLPSTKVRLILRSKDLAASLFNSPDSNPPNATGTPPSTPTLPLRMERMGLSRRTGGFEVELTPSPEDRLEAGRQALVSPSGRPKGRGYGAPSTKFPDLIRNDAIETLIITTKAQHTLPALRSLLPRLSSKSTVVLLQNGMGTLEGMLDAYWPEEDVGAGMGGGRPNFICATTTHGVWRKGAGQFVHAGMGAISFGVVPNRAVQSALAQLPSPSWGDNSNNPLLNPRCLSSPTLADIPPGPTTQGLHDTIEALLLLRDLNTTWLPLPTFQIGQLQKLTVNSVVNTVTTLIGVHNGALVGSQYAKSLVTSVCTECSTVFAAHLAREEGRWTPPTSPYPRASPHPPAPPLPISHPLSPESLIDFTLRVLFSTSPNLSSTLQDLLNTLPSPLGGHSPSSPTRTELEFINGYVVALAKRYELPVGVTSSLSTLCLLKEEMVRAGAVDRVVQGRMKAMGEKDSRKSVFEKSGEVGGKSRYKRAAEVKEKHAVVKNRNPIT